MKKAHLIFMAVLFALTFFAYPAFAEDASPSIQPIEKSCQTASDSEYMVAQYYNYSNCYAYTTCASGATISCQTYGNGCSYYVSQGEYVECIGYNYYGQWVRFFFTCN